MIDHEYTFANGDPNLATENSVPQYRLQKSATANTQPAEQILINLGTRLNELDYEINMLRNTVNTLMLELVKDIADVDYDVCKL